LLNNVKIIFLEYGQYFCIYETNVSCKVLEMFRLAVFDEHIHENIHYILYFSNCVTLMSTAIFSKDVKLGTEKQLMKDGQEIASSILGPRNKSINTTSCTKVHFWDNCDSKLLN
ncbi:hypothetical protein Anas_08635, partial [Armadillidium nasatum]